MEDAVIPEGFELEESVVIPEGFVLEKPLPEAKALPDPIGDEPATQRDYIGANIIEPALAVGTGIAAEAAAGIDGLINLPQGLDESVRNIEETREDLTFVPRTEAGKKGLQTFGDVMQTGLDLARVPLSGIAGVVELLTGRSPEEAANVVRAVKEIGFTDTFSDSVFEQTGSPMAAAIAKTLPGAAGALMGFKALPDTSLKSVQKATGTAVDTVKETKQALFKYQTPGRRRIAELLEAGEPNVDTVGFKLNSPSVEPKTRLGGLLKAGAATAQKDPIQIEAINQGFEPGVVNAIVNASKADKAKGLEMLKLKQAAKKNPLLELRERPSGIAGQTLLNNYKKVKEVNEKAGKDLDIVAKGLKNETVDYTTAVDSFIDDLDSMGITINKDFKLQFRNSDIEGKSPDAKNAQRILQTTMDRMSNTRVPSAYDVHRLKRFIDSQVTFGKTKAGMAGGAEGVLKTLRHNIDGVLDGKFPEYDKVNTIYAETIDAINGLKDVAGRKINLDDKIAHMSLGTLSRRILSQAMSGPRVLKASDDIIEMARKYSDTNLPKLTGKGLGKEDFLFQLLLVDELDRVFGSSARTSFMGQINQANKQGLNTNDIVDAATTTTGKVQAVKKVASSKAQKKINEQAAFEALRKLLESDNAINN